MKYCCHSASRALTVVLVVLSLQGWSQTSSLSPYSRFGIGTILPQGSPVHQALGGGTTGYINHFSANLENPASYSFLYNTTFDFGVRGSTFQLNDGTEQSRLNTSSVNHFALVLKRQGGKFAAALGLVPFSTTGYSITDTQTIDDIGEVSYTYDGQGGINRANAGLSYRMDIDSQKGLFDKNIPNDSLVIKHNISFGVNLDYYFGTLNQTRRALFGDPDYYHSRITSDISVADVTFSIGTQGLIHLSNKFKSGIRVARTDLMFGADYSMGTDLNAEFEEIAETIRFVGGAEIAVDTASYIGGLDGSITLPQKFGVGMSIHHQNKNDRSMVWTANYKAQDWSNFEGNFGVGSGTQVLTNSQSFSAGFQFVPKPIAKSNNIWQRSEYRFGVRATDTYLSLSDIQIAEQAVSFGMSIPMLKSRTFPASRFHFGTEFGNRGTIEQSLIEESFVNFFVGFTLTPHAINKWFVERKYD